VKFTLLPVAMFVLIPEKLVSEEERSTTYFNPVFAVYVSRNCVAETKNGSLIVIGTGSTTEMLTPGDTFVAPELSVASAVSVYVPAGILVTDKLKGALLTMPMEIEFVKNSTELIVPSESNADV